MYNILFNHFKIMCYWTYNAYKWKKKGHEGILSVFSAIAQVFFQRFLILCWVNCTIYTIIRVVYTCRGLNLNLYFYFSFCNLTKLT